MVGRLIGRREDGFGRREDGFGRRQGGVGHGLHMGSQLAQRGLVLLVGGGRCGRSQAGKQRLARLRVCRWPRLPSGVGQQQAVGVGLRHVSLRRQVGYGFGHSLDDGFRRAKRRVQQCQRHGMAVIKSGEELQEGRHGLAEPGRVRPGGKLGDDAVGQKSVAALLFQRLQAG